MSDSESESSDSDNNNDAPPFFDHYLRGDLVVPFEYDEYGDLDDESNSENELAQYINFGSSSSESEVVLHNTSDESDFQSDSSSHSSRRSFVPYVRIGGQTNEEINISAAKQNSWCIPKELYKREIGYYNKRAKWSSKFYQSEVAVQKLKLSKQLKSHDGCVNSLDFNSAGDVLASGSDDCRICLWNWSKGTTILKYINAHTKNIFQTKFLTTQGDVRIVSTGRDGLVVLSAVNNSDLIYYKIIARHDHQCNKLGVHHELPYVVLSCGEDGVVKNIDIRESPIDENERITNILHIKNSQGTNMHLYGIDINPMNPFEFIINGDDECVRMFDKRRLSNGPIKLFQRSFPGGRQSIDDNDSILSRESIYEPNITSAVYNYCGTEILASYSEDDIYLFDVHGPPKSFIHRYSGHINKSTIKSVNFYGPRSEYVVSGSDCGYLFIWDKKTEAIVQRKHADVQGAVNVLEGHPHMPTLATSGLDKTIKIWEPLSNGQLQNKKKLQMCILKNRLDHREHLRNFNTRESTFYGLDQSENPPPQVPRFF